MLKLDIKILLFSIIALAIAPKGLMAQFSKVDSFKTIINLHEPTDTNYILAHFELGRLYAKNSVEKALNYLDEGLCFIDSAPIQPKRVNRLDFLYLKASLFWSIKEFDSANVLIEEIEENLDSSVNKERLLIRLANLKGDIFLDKNQIEASEKHYRHSISLSKLYKDSTLLSINYNDFAKLFNAIEQPDSATYYMIKSAKINKALNNKGLLTLSYINIAILYESVGNDSLALNYYTKLLENKAHVTQLAMLPYAHNSVAEILINRKQYDEALFHLKEAMEYATSMENKTMLANVNQEIGKLYLEIGKFELANQFLSKSYITFEKANNISGQYITIALRAIATSKSDRSKARQLLYELSDMERSGDIPKKTITDNLNYLIQAAEAAGDYAMAFEYQKAYTAEKENQLKEDRELAALEMQAKYETEFDTKTKSLQIAAFEKEQERTKLIYNIGFLAFCFLMTAIVLLILNIYQKQKTNRVLGKTNKALQEANHIVASVAKQKEDFLSTMSHEIRTPMNAVIGMSDILLDESPRKDQVQNLNTLKFSAQNLLNIINDVLDFSKIEANKIQLEQLPFDINKLFRSIYNTFQLHNNLNKNNIDLKLHVEANNLENLIIGDTTRLSQIFTNLVGNALKFTKSGHIKMNIEVLSVDENQATIYFAVKDTGIGISEEFQKTVFDLYTQASDSTTRKFGGTGLGLAITKRLVGLLGSEIQLESTLGSGSTFHFTASFPLGEKITLSEPEQLPSSIHQKGLEGVRILVAEDHKINQIIIEKILKKWGTNITIVENGAEALENCQLHDYDVILMDIHMPVMDGIEATNAIRLLDHKNSKIPIIALTASVINANQKDDFSKNINGFVGKPFDPKTLFDTIYNSLENPSTINIPSAFSL